MSAPTRTFTSVSEPTYDEADDQATMDNQKQQWTSKLVGKTYHADNAGVTSTDTDPTKTFSDKDLPKPSRVLAPNSMATKDYRPNRLNVMIDDEGVCTHVYMG